MVFGQDVYHKFRTHAPVCHCYRFVHIDEILVQYHHVMGNMFAILEGIQHNIPFTIICVWYKNSGC